VPKRADRRKAPSGKAARAFGAHGMPAGKLDPSCLTEADAEALLSAVAAALNACEQARVTVKLAHGAVITPAGYVLAIYPDAGERFAVRTMALTEFPVTPDGEED
jgi:hypothetical protein